MKKLTLKTLKGKILFILEKYIETRDSDILLTVRIWTEFYKEFIDMSDIFRPKVSLEDVIQFLPSEDQIKRQRAEIQNVEGLYPPSDENVKQKRQRGGQA